MTDASEEVLGEQLRRFANGESQIVSGELVEPVEFDILDDLAGCDLSTASLCCDLGPVGSAPWDSARGRLEMLQVLRGLKKRGLVGCYRKGRHLVWAITAKGCVPFGGLSKEGIEENRRHGIE